MIHKPKAVLASLLVLFAVGCGGSNDDIGNNPPPADHAVSMTAADVFSPQTITANPGETIRWTNNDGDPHTVTPDVDNSGMTGSDTEFPNGVPTGQSFDFTVPANAAAGTRYFYHCRFHGNAGDGTALGTGMAGVIQIPATNPSTVDVAATGFAFSPKTVHVNPGDTVRWTNEDNAAHTVTGDVPAQGLDSGTQYPNGFTNGQTFSFTVPANTPSGTEIFYHCIPHGTAGDGTSFGTGMVGEIVVD